MIAEFALIFLLSCGNPMMGFMWGGEVNPTMFPVQKVEGGILVPSSLQYNYEYVSTHPDVDVTYLEVINPDIYDLVCATRQSM